MRLARLEIHFWLILDSVVSIVGHLSLRCLCWVALSLIMCLLRVVDLLSGCRNFVLRVSLIAEKSLVRGGPRWRPGVWRLGGYTACC